MVQSVSDILVSLEAEAQLLKLERPSSAAYHEACISFLNKAKNELADIQPLLKDLSTTDKERLRSIRDFLVSEQNFSAAASELRNISSIEHLLK
ncbi:hypothetical protein GN286_10465 [Rhodobacteraceae bacterium IMCC15231]|nr:hypothetical protein [Rhodobacteraceae bacterium IMCC15231]